ncbi:MAG TPA: DUF302 domain-containing protein [Actinomycetota bacterium]|nr:DUF302 domain-containing protein [Actinomycetota bacterium]
MTDYGYSVEVPEGYDEAVTRTRIAMRSEGFSILTEMNVGGMLGEEFGSARQYLIMGIYNAAVTNSRIGNDIQMAVHLPCNFVVQDMSAGAMVAALDPAENADPDQAPELLEEARAALARTFSRIGGPG